MTTDDDDADRQMALPREDRYSRQDLVWPRERLLRSTVLVIGAGAIGNEVVKGLALLGVGTIAVADMDHVSPSNLTRCVFFRDSDVGRRKATVVSRRAMALNPDITVRPIHGDIERTLGDSHYRDADVVLGCLDNAYARYVVNLRMRRVGKPWIDAGISADAAQVTLIGAKGPCWACSIGPRTVDQLRERHSCTGFRRTPIERTVPTTAVTTSIAAALQVQLAASIISGHDVPMGHRWTLMLDSARWLDDELSQQDECPFHDRPTPRPRRNTKASASECFADIVSELDLSAGARLLLRRDVVVGLRCDSCERTSGVASPLTELPQELALCETCGSMRTPITMSAVRASEPAARLPLRSMGLLDGDWAEYRDGRSRGRVVIGATPVYTRGGSET